MSRLSKPETKLHEEAESLINSSKELTFDDKWFILENWDPRANFNVGPMGAFFTPNEIAYMISMDYGIVESPIKVLDLCAGIGSLAFAISRSCPNAEFVCFEKNQRFVEIGKRILPDAKWIEGDLFTFDFSDFVGYFDLVVCNPPYGLRGVRKSTKLTSEKYALDLSRSLGTNRCFILPKNMEREGEVSNYDPHELIDQWRGVSVPVSIVWV